MTNELIPPTYLSPSSIGTFNQCPQKFRFNKIEQIPDPSNHWAVLGNYVHDILEEMYKADPQDRTISTCRVLAKALWDEKWGKEVVNVLRGFKTTNKILHLSDAEALRIFRWNAWWCVEGLWKLEDPTTVSPSGMEIQVSGEIGGVKIRGFVDRFGPSKETIGFTVTDYKTGKTPKIDIDEKFFQLLVYAQLLSDNGHGYVDSIELLYLKDAVRLAKTITEYDVSTTVETVQRTKSEIDAACDSGFFEARTSQLCNFCSYKKICPAWKR
jgi:putative RecB family exonuclease